MYQVFESAKIVRRNSNKITNMANKLKKKYKCKCETSIIIRKIIISSSVYELVIIFIEFLQVSLITLVRYGRRTALLSKVMINT